MNRLLLLQAACLALAVSGCGRSSSPAPSAAGPRKSSSRETAPPVPKAQPSVKATQEAPDYAVERFVTQVPSLNDPVGQNAYVLFDRKSNTGIIVDPGMPNATLDAFVARHAIQIKAVLNTHGHFDHVGGNRFYRHKYGVDVYAHAGDRGLLENAADQPTRRIAQQRELDLGVIVVCVLHTPGHSPGSVCFHVLNHLFTGDTLFAGTVGRTSSGAEARLLVEGIRDKLLSLPPGTRVYPGHGNMTTIGDEARANPFLQ